MSAVIQRVRVDWFQILADLSRAGVSGYQVAEKLGVTRSTVQQWGAIKTDIGYANGRALLALHLEHCGEQSTLQRITEAKQRA